VKKAIGLSFAIHLMVFLFLGLEFSKKELQQQIPENNTKPDLVVEVVEKPKSSESKSETNIISNDEVPIPKKDSEDSSCDSYYGGIGISQDYRTGMLTEIFNGYAAERAGLLVGDIVRSVTGEEIRGEVGTVLELKVYRNDQVFSLSLTREKICYNNI
jgi:carboxyl-terminal processing protease